MNVLFIYPSSGWLELASHRFFRTGAFLPPLGLLYLGKMLELNGHHVTIIDCNAEKVTKKTLERLLGHFDLVGMSVYSEPDEYECSKMIASWVKDIDSDIPLVIGGPHCSLHPEQALVDHQADVCVIGSAEFIINPVVEAFQGNGKLSSIPNILYKVKGKVKNTKVSQDVFDLDEIPFPARHLVEKYKYGYMSGAKITCGRLASVSSSRGCPMNCRFCGLHAHIPWYKSRSVENITQELAEIVDQGYETVVFVDDNFLAQKKKTEQVMDFIIKENLDLRLWITGARVDSADRRLYEKMRDAGVEYIGYGLESGNQDVLDYYNKRITLDDIRNATMLSREMGFFIYASFIIGAPIETTHHLENTIAFAISLPLDGATFYPFGYPYKSPVWEEAVEQGLIHPDEGTVMADSRRGLGMLTKDEIDSYTMKAHREFYINTGLWKRKIKDVMSQLDFRFVHLGVRMLYR